MMKNDNLSANFRGDAAQTVTALKAALDALCLKNAGIEGESASQQASFFQVTGHTAKITNALVALSKEAAPFGVEEGKALLDEGKLLCDLIRAELEGGLQ